MSAVKDYLEELYKSHAKEYGISIEKMKELNKNGYFFPNYNYNEFLEVLEDLKNVSC